MNQRPGANTDGFSIETKTKPKPNHLNAPGRTGRREPFLFEQRKGSAKMQGGDSAAVAARGIDRRRVRDRVDGGDKEQQTDHPNGVFLFQSTLEQEKAISKRTSHFIGTMILHSVHKCRAVYDNRISSGFRPVAALRKNE
jgi:hypothetical protein